MNIQTFGEQLEYLRLNQNFSRRTLCKGSCSEKQLYRIEKSESDPSVFILNQLSLRLNTDLLEIYKQYSINHLKGYNELNKINRYLQNYDIRNLRKFLNTLDYNTFLSNSLLLENYYYAHASCLYKLEKDFDSALFYINKGLNIEHDNPSKNISDIVFSNCGYCLLNLKASIFLRQKDYKKACTLFIEIKESLDKHFINKNIVTYLSPMFIHKIYTAALSNIVMSYYSLEEYQNVIYYSDIAITYSMKYYIMRHFQIVLDFKARALYKLGNIEESSRLFNTALTLYEMDEGYQDYIEELKEIITREFPLIHLI